MSLLRLFLLTILAGPVLGQDSLSSLLNEPSPESGEVKLKSEGKRIDEEVVAVEVASGIAPLPSRPKRRLAFERTPGPEIAARVAKEHRVTVVFFGNSSGIFDGVVEPHDNILEQLRVIFPKEGFDVRIHAGSILIEQRSGLEFEPIKLPDLPTHGK